MLNLPQSIERNLRGEIVERSIDVKDIEALEPADVVQVVHGKWIKGKYTDDDLRYNDHSYRCNRCGKIVDFEENYCPNCGAKMDKE